MAHATIQLVVVQQHTLSCKLMHGKEKYKPAAPSHREIEPNVKSNSIRQNMARKSGARDRHNTPLRGKRVFLHLSSMLCINEVRGGNFV